MGKEYIVAYRLSNELDRELKRVTGSHNRATGRHFTAEDFFRRMMQVGAGEEISRKLGIFREIYGVSEEKLQKGRKGKAHADRRKP